MTWVIYKLHYNERTGLVALKAGESAVKLIEKAQRNLHAIGRATGLTWRICKGDIAAALAASIRL